MTKISVRRLVRQGPLSGYDSIAWQVVGFWLWWRTWIIMTIILLSFVAFLRFTDASQDAYMGLFIGILMVHAVEKVSHDSLGL